jgi:hypothetical protein
VPTQDISPESETRWLAWLAKGRAADRRRNHKIRILLMVLASGAAVVVSMALVLW